MATESRRRLATVAALVVTFLLGGAAGAGVHASFDRRHPHPRWDQKGPNGEKRLPPPFEELSLTAEQRTEAQTVFEKYKPQFDAVFQDSMPKMKSLRDAMEAELAPILTDEQKTKLDALKKKHPPRFGPGGEGPPPPPPGN